MNIVAFISNKDGTDNDVFILTKDNNEYIWAVSLDDVGYIHYMFSIDSNELYHRVPFHESHLSDEHLRKD